MIVRLDNRLFEILDEMGARVDREMFMAAYAQRKAEKENDSVDPRPDVSIRP
ncbi:hypothetical protein HER88_004462 [Salmonella enterica]|nr:hypothetical protein [Salmonella enterica]